MSARQKAIWKNVAKVAMSCPEWIREQVKEAAREHVRNTYKLNHCPDAGKKKGE